MGMQHISSSRVQHLPETAGPGYVYAPETREPHLRDYIKMLRKRQRLVIVVFLLVFGLGVYITFSQTPLYAARAILKIDPQDPGVIQLHEILAAQSQGAISPFDETQLVLLRSRPLAARVITELGLESNSSFTQRIPPNILQQALSWVLGSVRAVLTYVVDLLRSSPPPQEKHAAAGGEERLEPRVPPGLVSRYLSFLTVSPIKNTRLVEIQFTTPNPKLSQRLADAHAEAFIRTSLETRFELTKEAREFLEKKLAELGKKVRQGEDALQQFRQTHGVVSLEGSENLVVERMVELNRRLTEARARRIELESLYHVIENRNQRTLSEVIDNNVIQQLKTTILNLEAQYTQLAATFTPSHPRLVEINEQIREARRRMDREVDNVVRKIQSDYGAARAREEALQAEAEQQQKAAIDLKEVGAQYRVLQTEADSNRALHENVLKRLNETTLSNDVPVSNIQITQPAERPQIPSSPLVERNLLLTITVGLFLGCGLALFLEYMDSNLHTPEDVWQAAAVPTLGVVPHLRAFRRQVSGRGRLLTPFPVRQLAHRSGIKNGVSSSELIVSYHPFSLLAESYYSICSSLLYGQKENAPQTILVTSARPGDGKTITTLNLAIALAQDGRNVVVVDADLRKGKCHAFLGIENHRGLTNVLTGRLTLEEGVQKTALPGLSLLTRGITPLNPMSLLGSPQMQAVLETLQQRFDFVLIDSPPAILLSDAAVLSQLCDGVLLVVRAQTTTSETARRLVEQMAAVHAPILGVVLNGVDIRTPDYADYIHYYKSYYSSDLSREERKN